MGRIEGSDTSLQNDAGRWQEDKSSSGPLCAEQPQRLRLMEDLTVRDPGGTIRPERGAAKRGERVTAIRPIEPKDGEALGTTMMRPRPDGRAIRVDEKRLRVFHVEAYLEDGLAGIWRSSQLTIARW